MSGSIAPLQGAGTGNEKPRGSVLIFMYRSPSAKCAFYISLGRMALG